MACFFVGDDMKVYIGAGVFYVLHVVCAEREIACTAEYQLGAIRLVGSRAAD